MILWSMVDNAGNTFNPLRGCRGDAAHFTHGDVNAGLCEKNFADEGGGELSVSLTEADRGIDQDGNIDAAGDTTNWIFEETGTHTVTLYVTSIEGCVGDVTHSDIVEVYPVPEAGFIYEPQRTTT